MKAKGSLIVIFKIFILTISLFFIEMAASLAAGLSNASPSADQRELMLNLSVVYFMSAAAISYPVIRTKWWGWSLVAAVFVIMFGIRTVLTQVETVVFMKYLVNIIPAEMIPKLVIQGFITAALFSPVVVLVHGKMRRKGWEPQTINRFDMTLGQWAGRLLLIAVIYIFIYIGFGMFVFRPLAGEAFEAFYAGLKMPEWMVLFQGVRALIWTGIAVLTIKMMPGRRWEAGLSVALLFSVLMGFMLLIPNGFMPDEIRWAHFVEVTSSNFVFGWITALVLPRKRFVF